jgi:ankyrin repeat protein
MISMLLKRGADVNAADRSGETALMKSTQKGFREATELLLDNGANPNAQDISGLTSLMVASDF